MVGMIPTTTVALLLRFSCVQCSSFSSCVHGDACSNDRSGIGSNDNCN